MILARACIQIVVVVKKYRLPVTHDLIQGLTGRRLGRGCRTKTQSTPFNHQLHIYEAAEQDRRHS